MHHESRHAGRSIGAVAFAAALAAFGTATPIAATGTCAGTRSEYIIPAEQRDLDPLAVYDKNGDGIICVTEPTGRFKVVKYTDNKI